MSMVQLGGLNVSKASYTRAREIVENKPQGKRKSAGDVLESLRKMMPGWTITTSKTEWSEGVRNIEICERVLERMAEDPEVMVKFKALILDLEEAVPALEEWAKEHPGQTLDFAFDIEGDGQLRAIAILMSHLGQESRTTFELPTDRGTWSDIIRGKLDALAQGRVEDAQGNKSWVV
ncbi:MAG: DUF6033 family protein [Defluviitaleaceae bacterium]|nr:DUF6033 family protein [Defluviitaleaceae bacterium]MCL2239993.1 DUF6033 family protein [Defluviitaleaceae bacterium]